MYGLGGGFGGMPYQSPGASIIGGIEAGAGFIRSAQDQADRRDQMQYERAREDRLDKMHQAQIDFANRHIEDQEERQRQVDALNSLRDEGNELSRTAQATIAKYGSYDKVPDEEQQMLTDAINSHRARMSSVQGAIYGKFQQDEINWQKGYLEHLNKGGFDPTQPGAQADFFRFVNGVGINDPADYLPGPDGSPSKIAKGLDDYNAGTANGDSARATAGVSAVMGNQINTHLGVLNDAGGTVTERSLNADRPVVPTPDGQSMMPVVTVDAEHPDGSTSTQPAQPRPVGGVEHPDNQDLTTITPDRLHQHLGAQGNLAAIIAASPALQDAIRNQSANPPQRALDWAQAVTAIGASSTPKMWKSEKNADGSIVNREFDSSGRATGNTQVLQPPTPKEGAETEADRKDAAAKRLIGQTNPDTGQPYTQEEIDRQTVFGSAATPKANISEADINDTKDNVISGLGFTKDPNTGLYKGSDGALPDWRGQAQIKAANDYVEKVLRQARVNKQPVNMDQVRTMAAQQADLATHGVPDWQPGTMHQFPAPSPQDGKPMQFRGEYRGGDPRNPKNYRNVTWTPIDASAGDTPTPSTAAGQAKAAGNVQGPTPAAVAAPPPNRGIKIQGDGGGVSASY